MPGAGIATQILDLRKCREQHVDIHALLALEDLADGDGHFSALPDQTSLPQHRQGDERVFFVDCQWWPVFSAPTPGRFETECIVFI